MVHPLTAAAAATTAILIGVVAAHAAWSLPKKGHDGQCYCLCDAPSGNFAGNYYNSNGLSCNAFMGATCNIENPETHLIETGKLSLPERWVLAVSLPAKKRTPEIDRSQSIKLAADASQALGEEGIVEAQVRCNCKRTSRLTPRRSPHPHVALDLLPSLTILADRSARSRDRVESDCPTVPGSPSCTCILHIK